MSPRGRGGGGGGGDAGSTGGGGDTGSIGGGGDTGSIGGGGDTGSIGGGGDGDTGIIGGNPGAGTIGGNPDSSDGDNGGSSFSPPSAKKRQPGTLHPLTEGTKKAIRDGASAVYITYAVISFYQLITALMKLFGCRRTKGFQRTIKYKLLMVLTTMTLLTVYALGAAYTRVNPTPPDPRLFPVSVSAFDDAEITYETQITQLYTMQLADDFLAKVAQWLVFLSTLTLIYDYAAYKASGDASVMSVWAKDRLRLLILYVLSPALAITGAVQLAIFMTPIQRGEVLFPSEDVEDTEAITRKVVAWVFLICFVILISSLKKAFSATVIYVPELKHKGIICAIVFLIFLALFFFVDAILISIDSLDQGVVKLVEITVVGGLTGSIVWSLLWESNIKPAPKAVTPE